MKKIAMSMLVIAVMAGCAPLTFDRRNLSNLQIVPGSERQEFIFQSVAAWGLREDDPAAEGTRMADLDLFLRLNNMCPSGYEILDRQPVETPTKFQIHYHGRCL